MPSIRITTTLTNEERDSLYLGNIPLIVLLFDQYYRKNKRYPTLSWYRKQLIITDSMPTVVDWEYNIDHILPQKMAGKLNHPKNLIIIPACMNKSFGKFIDKDKLNFIGNDIFNTATEFLKDILEDKQEYNPFGIYKYTS
uniref:Uncharacterized protein n=1 Tax=viral metagenome TaxID=1070528 RepID=A0A6C0LVF5_9ZZZZ